jgi:hypothetical protein
MGLAQKVMDPSDTISPEASERINSARVRDLAFAVRTAARDKNLQSEDVDSLARAVMKTLDQNKVLSYQTIYDSLLALGRSTHKAALLAKTIFP